MDFIAFKNLSSSAVFQPANLGSNDKHTNHYTTEAKTHQFTIKSSRATSRVKIELQSNFSEALSAPLVMEAERASETLDGSAIVTRLFAREDFLAFSRRESFKSYTSSVSSKSSSRIIELICKIMEMFS
jgi:hypothetical protein